MDVQADSASGQDDGGNVEPQDAGAKESSDASEKKVVSRRPAKRSRSKTTKRTTRSRSKKEEPKAEKSAEKTVKASEKKVVSRRPAKRSRSKTTKRTTRSRSKKAEDAKAEEAKVEEAKVEETTAVAAPESQAEAAVEEEAGQWGRRPKRAEPVHETETTEAPAEAPAEAPEPAPEAQSEQAGREAGMSGTSEAPPEPPHQDGRQPRRRRQRRRRGGRGGYGEGNRQESPPPAAAPAIPVSIAEMLSETWTEEKARRFLKEGFLMGLGEPLVSDGEPVVIDGQALAERLRVVRKMLADECMVEDEAADVMLLDIAMNALADRIEVYKISAASEDRDDVEQALDLRYKADRRLIEALTALKNI